jgi:predicted flap endonuclease-1-like 5' DNA nuclease
MAEEHSRVVRPGRSDQAATSGLVEEPGELLEEIDALEDSEDDSDSTRTGEFRRPSADAPARTSAPPPLPPDARVSQRASALPPPRAAGDVSKSPASNPPPYSGMFRIDRPDSAISEPSRASIPPSPPESRVSAPPPPPSGASEPAELKRALAVAGKELREHVTQNQRLRLTLRLREDRIHELETLVQQERDRAAAIERELAGLRAERTGDDLKRISGIGPGFERALHAIGVTTFLQIAEWTPTELERAAREIRTTPRRIIRDRWVERARELVAQSNPPAA